MHRLFIDQNVRIEVARALREDGYEVVHASDADLERRDDESILRYSNARGLTVPSTSTSLNWLFGADNPTTGSYA